MTMMTFLPASGGEREPQHRRVRLDPLRLLLAHRLRHPPLQSLRAHQGSQWSYSRSCFKIPSRGIHPCQQCLHSSNCRLPQHCQHRQNHRPCQHC